MDRYDKFRIFVGFPVGRYGQEETSGIRLLNGRSHERACGRYPRISSHAVFQIHVRFYVCEVLYNLFFFLIYVKVRCKLS